MNPFQQMWLWATSLFVKRDTMESIPIGYYYGNKNGKYVNSMKRTLSYRDLRNLSKTPLARSAINQIRDGVLNLDWKVVSIDGKAHKKEIDLVTRIVRNPNGVDDYEQFLTKIIDDLLVLDQATFEKKKVNKRGARPLYLFPIDAQTIEIVDNWSGDPKDYRYAQDAQTGDKKYYTGNKVAMIQRSSFTYDDFGYSPLQTAYDHLRYLIEVQEYSNQISSDSMPKYLINLGKVANQEELERVRAYIENSLQGQSTLGVVATETLESKQVSPIGDEACSLSWQKMIMQVIAVCFNIPAEKLGIAISNDRSTVAEKDSNMLEYTIKPWSRVIERAINEHVIRFLGLEEKIRFEYIYAPTASQQTEAVERVRKLLDGNLITINEGRAMLDGITPIELTDIPDGELTILEYKNKLATDLALTQQKLIEKSDENTDTIDTQEEATKKDSEELEKGGNTEDEQAQT